MTEPARPSLMHRALVTAARPLGFNKKTAADARAKIAKRDARTERVVPPVKAVAGLRVSVSDRVGWPVWSIEPVQETDTPRPVVIAVHGGAYVSEILGAHWSFYADLVRSVGVEVIAPIYPLAPHGTAGTVVPVVADLIAEQIRLRGADLVGVEGDSAGGGLVLAAVQELVRRGSDVPARMVLISPWLDATVSDPRSRGVNDPLLSIDSLVEDGRQWAGDLRTDDPLVSPINGSMAGLPRTAVYAGTLDLLHPDSLRLRDIAEEQHLDMEFDIRDGLLHGWAGFSVLPEAKQVAGRITTQLTGRAPGSHSGA